MEKEAPVACDRCGRTTGWLVVRVGYLPVALCDECRRRWETFMKEVRPYLEDLGINQWKEKVNEQASLFMAHHNPNIDGFLRDKKMELEDKIFHGDCLEILRTFPDASIDLVVTSPPYPGNNKMWGELYHERNIARAHEFLNQVWDECVRVLKTGCKLCINIANTKRRPYIPNTHYIYQHLIDKVEPLGEIIWNKGYGQCFDKKTRVLTDSGFKLFSEIDINKDMFATLNLQTREIEYQKAYRSIKYKYHGMMYQLKSKVFNLIITPEHNIVCGSRRDVYENKKYKLENIHNWYESETKNVIIPKNRFSEKEKEDKETFSLPGFYSKFNPHCNEKLEINMDDWLRFLGIYLTDGCSTKHGRGYDVVISQVKPRFKQEIRDLLNTLPFNFTEEENRFLIYSSRLGIYLSEFGLKVKRKIPSFITALNTRQKRIFIDWVMKGDGAYKEDGKYQYIMMASKDFINSLSKLLVDTGYHFSKKEIKAKSGIIKGRKITGKRPLQRILFNYGEAFTVNKERDVTMVPYSGFVYCVSVPNHTVFVERNGKCTWSGNCGTAWGSFRSPADPALADQHEYILIFRKGGLRHKPKKFKKIDQFNFKSWRNSIWNISPRTSDRADHCAPFPDSIPARLIQLYSFEGEIVLDPFIGSGTTAIVARDLMRKYVGIEIIEDYYETTVERLRQQLLFECKEDEDEKKTAKIPIEAGS